MYTFIYTIYTNSLTNTFTLAFVVLMQWQIKQQTLTLAFAILLHNFGRQLLKVDGNRILTGVQLLNTIPNQIQTIAKQHLHKYFFSIRIQEGVETGFMYVQYVQGI